MKELARPEGPGLATELLAAISAVRRTTRRVAQQAWPADRLPVAQKELLHLVAARPGVTVAEAATDLRLAPNTVSTLVSRLETAGLLNRERAPADARRIRLTVTHKALKRIADWRDLRAELTQKVIAELPAAERQALASAVPALQLLAQRMAAA